MEKSILVSLVWSRLSRATSCSMLTNEDVQLNKDDVPVIYHEFLMSEIGIDAPLNNLSLE